MARKDRLPPRTLPVVYLAVAHVALAFAFVLLALEPQSIGSFFYNARMFAVVHLVTLGWLTACILGLTYVAAPIALRTSMPAGPFDAVACGAYLVGMSGVVAHFWIGGYWGIASSGALLLLAAGVVAVRTWRALARGEAPLPVRLHVGFAYGNLVLAGLWGVLLAANKESSFLPVSQVPAVFAHAHLATVGWVAMTFVGIGYRMLPMLFPAAPPSGRPLWISLLLFEVGVLGLASTLALESGLKRLFAVVTAAALAFFFGLVVWMRRHPRPPPKKLRRPDFGVLHTLQALGYLLFTVGVGLFLVFSDALRADWVLVYGTCGLVGFLAQAVVGVGMRLFPMFAWTEAYAGHDYAALPPSPHVMPLRVLQLSSLLCWTAGVPGVAYGLGRNEEACVIGGAWLLAAGTVVGAVNTAWVLSHAYRAPKTKN